MCIIWVRSDKNRSTNLRLKLIVRYTMFKDQFVLYKDKGLLELPHHTEFVRTMSKEIYKKNQDFTV